MSETSQSFRHEAEKIFTSTSEFHFPGMDQVLESANQNGQETVQSDACFELLPKDERAPKLKFIFRNGNRCTIPYAYFLRTEFDMAGTLSLFTSEKEIVIEGRGLDFLEERLYDNQMVWIRESKGTFDSGQDRVFVKGIKVRNRLEK
jgi:hypothetical protein